MVAKKVKAFRLAIRFLIPEAEVLEFGVIIGIASILAIVIDKEVTKTKASILAFRAVNTWKRNAFFAHSSSRLPDIVFS